MVFIILMVVKKLILFYQSYLLTEQILASNLILKIELSNKKKNLR